MLIQNCKQVHDYVFVRGMFQDDKRVKQISTERKTFSPSEHLRKSRKQWGHCKSLSGEQMLSVMSWKVSLTLNYLHQYTNKHVSCNISIMMDVNIIVIMPDIH